VSIRSRSPIQRRRRTTQDHDYLHGVNVETSLITIPFASPLPRAPYIAFRALGLTRRRQLILRSLVPYLREYLQTLSRSAIDLLLYDSILCSSIAFEYSPSIIHTASTFVAIAIFTLLLSEYGGLITISCDAANLNHATMGPQGLLQFAYKFSPAWYQQVWSRSI
jgi:hypothetical protein